MVQTMPPTFSFSSFSTFERSCNMPPTPKTSKPSKSKKPAKKRAAVAAVDVVREDIEDVRRRAFALYCAVIGIEGSNNMHAAIAGDDVQMKACFVAIVKFDAVAAAFFEQLEKAATVVPEIPLFDGVEPPVEPAANP